MILASGMVAVQTAVFLKQASITMNVLFLVKKLVFAVSDGIPKRIICLPVVLQLVMVSVVVAKSQATMFSKPMEKYLPRETQWGNE